MTSHATRQFMAAMAVTQHHGRPHTPTDQVWIETLFGHIKHEWPHLEAIDDSAVLEVELERVQHDYNAVRLTQGSATSPPTTNTKAEETSSAKQHRGPPASPRRTYHLPSTPDHQPPGETP